MKINLHKTITPLLWRVIVFIVLFVIISGVLGPRIISGGILFRDGFSIYGGVGKALIFSLIAFVLLARHNKVQIALKAWQSILLSWGAAALLCFVLSWAAVSGLLAGTRTAGNLTLAHSGLLLGLIFTAIGCMGLRNIQTVWGKYRREIVISIVIGALFFVFLQMVYALWQPLAWIVMHGVNILLNNSGLDATIIPPNTLIFDKFGITVAEFCSGVESIALFTGLYAIVGLLDWDKLNRRRYFAIFPLALLVLFMLNILRVYGLIMAGYYIDQEIAFSLFHTYAGMVFFILYSLVFWTIAYKYLVSKPNKEKI